MESRSQVRDGEMRSVGGKEQWARAPSGTEIYRGGQDKAYLDQRG